MRQSWDALRLYALIVSGHANIFLLVINVVVIIPELADVAVACGLPHRPPESPLAVLQ